METWLFFALIAPAFWATVNLLDKKVLGRLTDVGPFLYTIFAEIVAFPLMICLIIITGTHAPSGYNLLYVIIVGLLTPTASFVYFLAIKRSEPVTIAILFQTIPAFSLFFGYQIFNEQLVQNQYYGLFLLIVGSITATLIASRDRPEKTPSKRGYWLIGVFTMLLSSLLFSLSYVFQKLASEQLTSLDILIWSNVTSFVMAISVLFVISLWFKSTLKKTNPVPFKTWGIAVLSVIINLLGTLSIIEANSQGPIALVSAIAASQPMYVMLFSLVISSNERKDVTVAQNIFRLFAVMLIVVGIYLINLHS